ncbi:BioY family protein [compost metagenome]
MLKLLRILLVTSLTALGAFVVLPLPFLVAGVPALPGAAEALSWKSLSVGLFYPSAQLLGVWIAGCWLGPRAGVTSMLLYLALGVFGLPVFIDGGGLHYGQHGAMLPLLAFPVAAGLISRVRGAGTGRRTFWALLAGTLLISSVAVVSNVAGTGLWLDGRQWLAFAKPQFQALGGWLAMMVLFSVAGSVIHRAYQVWAPPAPPEEPQPEPETEETADLSQLALPSGRPQNQRSLPPAIAESAKRLAAPTKPQLPDR